MTSLEEQIHDALSPLIGLPLWDASRALDIQMFRFGERHTWVNYKGHEVEVGDYAVHVQCPWRIVGPSGIVVGSYDRFFPADEDKGSGAFDREKDLALLEAAIHSWLDRYERRPLRVTEVRCDSLGGFELSLQRSYNIQVFPASCRTDEHSEHWRIFAPTDEEPHFVVTGGGVR